MIELGQIKLSSQDSNCVSNANLTNLSWSRIPISQFPNADSLQGKNIIIRLISARFDPVDNFDSATADTTLVRLSGVHFTSPEIFDNYVSNNQVSLCELSTTELSYLPLVVQFESSYNWTFSYDSYINLNIILDKDVQYGHQSYIFKLYYEN